MAFVRNIASSDSNKGTDLCGWAVIVAGDYENFVLIVAVLSVKATRSSASRGQGAGAGG